MRPRWGAKILDYLFKKGPSALDDIAKGVGCPYPGTILNALRSLRRRRLVDWATPPEGGKVWHLIPYPTEDYAVRDVVEWMGKGRAMKTDLASNLMFCYDPASAELLIPALEKKTQSPGWKNQRKALERSLMKLSRAIVGDLFLPLEDIRRDMALKKVKKNMGEDAITRYDKYVENEQWFDFLRLRISCEAEKWLKPPPSTSVRAREAVIERAVKKFIKGDKEIEQEWNRRPSVTQGLRSIFSLIQRRVNRLRELPWLDRQERALQVSLLSPLLRIAQELRNVPLLPEEMNDYQSLLPGRKEALRIQAEVDNEVDSHPLNYALVASPRLQDDFIKVSIKAKIARATKEELERYVKNLVEYRFFDLLRDIVPDHSRLGAAASWQAFNESQVPIESVLDIDIDLLSMRAFHDHYPSAFHEPSLRSQQFRKRFVEEFLAAIVSGLTTKIGEIDDARLIRKFRKLTAGEPDQFLQRYREKLRNLQHRARKDLGVQDLLRIAIMDLPAFFVLEARAKERHKAEEGRRFHSVGQYDRRKTSMRMNLLTRKRRGGWKSSKSMLEDSRAEKGSIVGAINRRIAQMQRQEKWKDRLANWDFNASSFDNILQVGAALMPTDTKLIQRRKGGIFEFAEMLADIPLLPEERLRLRFLEINMGSLSDQPSLSELFPNKEPLLRMRALWEERSSNSDEEYYPIE